MRMRRRTPSFQLILCCYALWVKTVSTDMASRALAHCVRSVRLLQRNGVIKPAAHRTLTLRVLNEAPRWTELLRVRLKNTHYGLVREQCSDPAVSLQCVEDTDALRAL